MASYADDLKRRTKRFALEVLAHVRRLPATDDARIIGRQLLRAGTAVGANYRSACRARSRRDFISKVGLVLEEADEAAF
jgi:four helix bundle protein